MKCSNLSKSVKSKPTSLNVKLFHYFLVFTIVLLAVVWVLEIGTLSFSYRKTRTREIIAASKQIKFNISSDKIDNIIDKIVVNNDMGLLVINIDTMDIIESNAKLITNVLNREDYTDIAKEFASTYDGEDMCFSVRDDYLVTKTENLTNRIIGQNITGLIYITSTTNPSNQRIAIAVVGSLVPIESTISTLKYQLLLISIVMLVVSVVISSLASSQISEPIKMISESAKNLSKGNFNIHFTKARYYEIDELADTLNKTAVDLKKADKMQQDLIANISHDLRTPLTMISGYGELIRDIPEENTRENVQVIIDEAKRLASLVNNILDISKLQSGTDSINITEINVNDMVYNVYTHFQKVNESYGYTIELDGIDEVYYVKGDIIRIQQVFYNLINNAINHIGDDKKVLIRYRKLNNNIRFEIIDNGEGIKEEDTELIWERYYKANKSKRYETGSGLGLSIVKTILDLHNVDYGVDSTYGKGSNFWFELPIVENQLEL